MLQRSNVPEISENPPSFQSSLENWGKDCVTWAHWLSSTPRAPVQTGARMLPIDAIAGVAGVLTRGVHFEAMSAGVSAIGDEGQHMATHSWGNISKRTACSESEKPQKQYILFNIACPVGHIYMLLTQNAVYNPGTIQRFSRFLILTRRCDVSTYCGRKPSRTSVGWRGTWSICFPAVCNPDRSSSDSEFPACSGRLCPEGSGRSPPHCSDPECGTSVDLQFKSSSD